MKYIGNIPEQNVVHTWADRYDYVYAGLPTININPSTKYATWLNSLTGEVFVCIDTTEGVNVWKGQLGTNVSNITPLVFDGSDDYIATPWGNGYGGDITFECYIFYQSSGTSQYIFSSMTSDYVMPFRFVINADGTVSAERYSSGYKGQANGATVLSENVWYRVAASYNATTGDLRVYVDGFLDGSATNTTLITGAADYYLGTDPGTPVDTHMYKGEMYDIRVWTEERSVSQIAAAEHTLEGNEVNLIMYFPTDDSSDSALYDHSINGNDGTIYGKTG